LFDHSWSEIPNLKSAEDMGATAIIVTTDSKAKPGPKRRKGDNRQHHEALRSNGAASGLA